MPEVGKAPSMVKRCMDHQRSGRLESWHWTSETACKFSVAQRFSSGFGNGTPIIRWKFCLPSSMFSCSRPANSPRFPERLQLLQFISRSPGQKKKQLCWLQQAAELSLQESSANGQRGKAESLKVRELAQASRNERGGVWWLWLFNKFFTY